MCSEIDNENVAEIIAQEPKSPSNFQAPKQETAKKKIILIINKKARKRLSDTQKLANYAIMTIHQMLHKVPQHQTGDQSFEM